MFRTHNAFKEHTFHGQRLNVQKLKLLDSGLWLTKLKKKKHDMYN